MSNNEPFEFANSTWFRTLSRDSGLGMKILNILNIILILNESNLKHNIKSIAKVNKIYFSHKITQRTTILKINNLFEKFLDFLTKKNSSRQKKTHYIHHALKVKLIKAFRNIHVTQSGSQYACKTLVFYLRTSISYMLEIVTGANISSIQVKNCKIKSLVLKILRQVLCLFLQNKMLKKLFF